MFLLYLQIDKSHISPLTAVLEILSLSTHKYRSVTRPQLRRVVCLMKAEIVLTASDLHVVSLSLILGQN